MKKLQEFMFFEFSCLCRKFVCNSSHDSSQVVPDMQQEEEPPRSPLPAHCSQRLSKFERKLNEATRCTSPLPEEVTKETRQRLEYPPSGRGMLLPELCLGERDSSTQAVYLRTPLHSPTTSPSVEPFSAPSS